MASGADVLGCLGAIVSAFHGAAGLVQTIQQRNERRRRMNGISQDGEEAFAEKMLLKSLQDGETQCKSARDEKHKRYGPAFKQGDMEALSALKDVMVNLQMDIISALQVAQAVANAKLDYSRLHEAVIMNKSQALRALDDLCKRLPTVEFEEDSTAGPQSTQDKTLGRPSGEVRMTGVERPLAVTLPSSPPSSPPQRPAVPASARPSRTQSQPLPEARPASPKKRSGLARMFSNLGASLSMANDDYGAFQRTLQTERTETLREAERERKSPDPDEMARHTTRDSGFGGSDTSSRHQHTPSITSTLFPDDRRSSIFAESKPSEGTPRNDSETIPSIPVFPGFQSTNSSGFLHPNSSSTALSLRPNTAVPVTQWDEDDEVMRATLAPEVVTPGFESMLPYRPNSRPGAALLKEAFNDVATSVHPAFRIDPHISPPEKSSEWATHRPSNSNVYQNFCQGAWQIRDRLEEGLSIALVPSPNGNVSYWKCKHCEFRTKATSSSPNTSSLPDRIYILPSGVRYRWLFLAKSHVRAETSQSKIESYVYGCAFCAAEGRETATHANLDALMAHIVAKHKTSMMTPEVKAQAGCVVGDVDEDTDHWDINLPEGGKRGKLGGVFGRR